MLCGLSMCQSLTNWLDRTHAARRHVCDFEVICFPWRIVQASGHTFSKEWCSGKCLQQFGPLYGVLCPLGCARLDIVREIRTFTGGSPILMVRLHLMEVFDALADGQGEIKDIPQRWMEGLELPHSWKMRRDLAHALGSYWTNTA